MARKRRGLHVLALVFSVALIAAACGDSKESSDGDGGGSSDGTTTTVAPSGACRTLEFDDVEEGGELVDYAQLASGGDNSSFDPAYVQTLDEAQVTNALFDGLADFDFTDTCNPKLKPLVAEKWEANDDATEFTWTIKEGQKFSNGEPVLPSNFKIAWERFGNPEVESYYSYLINYIKGGADLADGKVTTLDSIVADDDAMTLKVTLEKPNADFPAIVVLSEFSPISQEDYKRLGTTKPGWGKDGAYIGNGPYKLESAGASDSGEVVLVRNDDWAGNVLGDTKANLDKITFKITSDVESAYQAFEAGDGDTATIPSGKYQDAMSKYPNTVESAVLGTYFFDFGADDPATSGEANTKLRQAISLAIDRDEINRKAYEGVRTISTGITPPGIPGFKSGICKYCTTDAEEAKKLYKEWQDAGGKLDGPIKIDFNSGGSHQDVAAIIQANLKDVLGIDAELNGIEEGYFQAIGLEGACHICRSGWYADYPTYGNFMVDLFGAISIDNNNFGRHNDPVFEDLIAKAQEETDATKRGELYNQAEEQLLNVTTSAIPLNWYSGDQVYRDTLVNYDQPPLGLVYWEKVGKTS